MIVGEWVVSLRLNNVISQIQLAYKRVVAFLLLAVFKIIQVFQG